MRYEQELLSNMSFVPLGDLLLEPLRNGLTKPKAVRGDGVKMIGMGEIFANSRIGAISMSRVPVTEKELSNNCIKNGDILFARQSLALEGAGKCSIVIDVTEETVFESHLIRARIDSSKANPYFVYYYFNSYVGKEHIKTIVEQVAAAGIRGSDLVRLKVPCPDLETQDRIAAILSALDEKIAINRAINDNLQQQLFSLYENMAMTSPCLKEYTLSNLCDFQEGYVNPPQTHPEYFDGEVKWLRAVDINESFIIETSRTLTKAGFESAKKSALLFKPNTIAISKSGTIGRLGIIADYMCGNRAVINIAPHDTNMLAFIYCFLKGKQREFPDMAVGSVQKNLYVSLLEPLTVFMPDDELLTEFNAVGNLILNKIYNNCIENTELANLRDTLLPKFMSGEIDASTVQL